MAVYSQTLQQVVDDIKVEARVQGADDLNVWIASLVNDELLSATQNSRYYQLSKYQKLVMVDATGEYQLPADYADIKKVYWTRDKVNKPRDRVLRHKNDYVEQSRDGLEPKFYELVGPNTISIWPYKDVKAATDELEIAYFAYPLLQEADTLFPFPELLGPIKRKVVARVLARNKDLQGAAMQDSAGEKNMTARQTTEENNDT